MLSNRRVAIINRSIMTVLFSIIDRSIMVIIDRSIMTVVDNDHYRPVDKGKQYCHYRPVVVLSSKLLRPPFTKHYRPAHMRMIFARTHVPAAHALGNLISFNRVYVFPWRDLGRPVRVFFPPLGIRILRMALPVHAWMDVRCALIFRVFKLTLQQLHLGLGKRNSPQL